MIKKILIIAIVLIFSSVCLGGASAASRTHSKTHIYYEKDYQRKWCKAHCGIMEYELDDQSRVDCLTDQYAVEFDFAKKVYESIGQAFFYAAKTGKKPGVVLIIENPASDAKYLNKLRYVSAKFGLDYWIMTQKDME